jgi:hypothetical protein
MGEEILPVARAWMRKAYKVAMSYKSESMKKGRYGNLECNTRNAFMKFDKRLGVSELDYELRKRVKGYSESRLRVLGGVVLVSAFLLFITGMYLFYNHASMLSGPTLFSWNAPFIDYAESLYCWAANILLLSGTFIFIRGSFYAVYKSHGYDLWFAALGMLAMNFFFMLVMGVYEHNATCVHLLPYMFTLIGLSQFQAVALTPSFGFWCLLVSAFFYVSFLIVYLDSIRRHGQLPVPTYNLQIKAKRQVHNFKLGVFTICGTALLAGAILGALSLASLSLHGIVGAYNTNTFKELWITYPIMTLGEYFGDIGIFFGLLIPFAYLSLIPFADRNLFMSWKRRKPIIAIGIIVMIAYVVLGFMSILPGQIEVSAVMHSAPAFAYPEFPWISASIIISGLLGIYLLKKRNGK